MKWKKKRNEKSKNDGKRRANEPSLSASFEQRPRLPPTYQSVANASYAEPLPICNLVRQPPPFPEPDPTSTKTYYHEVPRGPR